MSSGLIFGTEVDKVFFNNEEVESIWIGDHKVWPVTIDSDDDMLSNSEKLSNK